MWTAKENNYITKDSLSSPAIRCSFVVLSCPAPTLHGFLFACLLLVCIFKFCLHPLGCEIIAKSLFILLVITLTNLESLGA